MVWQEIAWRWLAHSATTGLIVLAAGSAAVALCRQPVGRARLVVFTVLGSLIVPWLGLVPLVPRWSTARFLPGAEIGARVRPGRPVVESLVRPEAVQGLPPAANESGTGGPARDRTESVVRVGSPRVDPIAWPQLVLAA